MPLDTRRCCDTDVEKTSQQGRARNGMLWTAEAKHIKVFLKIRFGNIVLQGFRILIFIDFAVITYYQIT